MRMSPKNSSSSFCLIFSSSDFFALFSKPEYVWTTYHFLSIFFCSAAIDISSLVARVLDLVGEVLPGRVEEAKPDDRAPGPLACQGAGERLRGPAVPEDREQHVLQPEAGGQREDDVSDGGDAGIGHGSTRSDWQASQDSNLEHAVLETAALPLELLAFSAT